MTKKKSKLEVVKEKESGKEDLAENTNKPSPEETQQFKDEFDAAMKEFAETKFQISDASQFAANDTVMFLLDYMQKYALWSKTGWMGIIKMHDVLQEEIKKDNETSGLCLDYQALEFCGYMLMNPGAVGYEKAIEFEKIADKYSQIMVSVGKKVEEARAKLKKVQYLQEKWAAAEQGFYLADLEPKEEKSEEDSDKEGTVIEMKPENPNEETLTQS